MTIQLELPRVTELKPRITVVGVGGAGGNAVNNMISAGLTGVEYIVANTDAQALSTSSAELRIQLGAKLTEGLGAGSKPEIGRAAAEEALDDIRSQVSGSHMVFIAAGMGGGTGTGAAAVIARIAKELDILVIAIVTKPFQFEGARRMRMADAGIAELRRHVDTMIVIPNQNLFRVATERTTFAEAFVLADQVLYSGIACIVDLIVKEGLINLDLADVRTVLAGMGTAVMGTGEASGEGRATRAAEEAIANPLLDDVSLKGARGLLLSIIGGRNLTLYEVDEAASRVRREVDPEANIIVGATFDDSLDDRVRISIVASGMDPPSAPSIAEEARSTPAPRAPQPVFTAAHTAVVDPHPHQPAVPDPHPLTAWPASGGAQTSEPKPSTAPLPMPAPPAMTGAASKPLPLAPAPEAPLAITHPTRTRPDSSYPPLLPQLQREHSQREPSQREADDFAHALTVAYEQVPAHVPTPAAVTRLEPRRNDWHSDDGVTIEEQLAPLAAPPAFPARAPAERPAASSTFSPQPPVEIRRPTRRMPEITDFSEVAQRDYRAKSPTGLGAERGSAPQPSPQQSPPRQQTPPPATHEDMAPRRKQGLFERLSSFARRESDGPSDHQSYPQTRSPHADLGRRGDERAPREPREPVSAPGSRSNSQTPDFPDFFDKKRRF